MLKMFTVSGIPLLPCLYSDLKARLQLIRENSAGHFNWIFLPGGPGLGSESLAPLTQLLNLPGKIWHLDLPGDGSNITSNDTEYFSHWQAALIEAVQMYSHVVLVGHSTGGMYLLSTPELENMIDGIVLMNSAPNASWQHLFYEKIKQNLIPEMASLQKQYEENPSNDALKKLTLSSAPYLFTKEGLQNGIIFLESLAYNYKTSEWSENHFDSVYQSKWIPRNIPALILSGEKDIVTPLHLFSDDLNYQRKNILIKKISNAAHFPWMENPDEVIIAFKEYTYLLSC